MKGLEFVEVGGQTRLVFGSKETGELFQIDPATALLIGDPIVVQVPLSLTDPTLAPTQRILGLATHPDTGVLYGITEPFDSDPLSQRQLVTINPTTGVAALIGVLANAPDPLTADAAFAGIAFVGFRTLAGDFDGNGVVDGADFLEWQRGVGSEFDAGDLADWRANYGSGAAVGAAGAVPEPSALAIALFAVGGLLSGRRRR